MNTAAGTVAPSPDDLVVVGRAQKARIWGIAALVVALLAGLSCNEWWRPRLPPSPEGLVFQFVLPRDQPVVSCFTFVAVDRNGPAVAIFDSGRFSRTTTAESRPTITVLRYPSGEVLDRWVEPSDAVHQELLNSRLASTRFDLDGDGVEDRREWDFDGWVHVLSGVDGRKLWSSHDLLEHEWKDRVTPLGDLDGDGLAEFAVLHPRHGLSDYVLLDRVFGANSWVSIVSGSRVARR